MSSREQQQCWQRWLTAAHMTLLVPDDAGSIAFGDISFRNEPATNWQADVDNVHHCGRAGLKDSYDGLLPRAEGS
jgi:hypothetical protein